MRLRLAAFIVLVSVLAAAPVSAQVWREKIDGALAKKTSYDFKDMALADVIQTLSQDMQVNIILDDSRLAGIDPMQKLTLHYKDMSVGSIITWVTRSAGLQWCIQDEAIFITSYNRLDQASKLQIETRNAERRAEAARTWAPAMAETLARNLTVSFNAKSLADCRTSLEALLGVNVILSPSVETDEPITVAVSKMSAENVISWVARKADIDYAVMDEAVYLAPTEEIRIARAAGLDFSTRGKGADLVTFDFKDTTVQEAFAVLSEKSGVKIILKSDVEDLPRITLSGRDMQLSAAITAITKASGCNNAIVPQEDTYIVQLMKAAPAAAVERPMAEAREAEVPADASAPALESTAAPLTQ